jgi:hypothetical protein
MKITSLTLHFFEPAHLALLFPRQKKKNPRHLFADILRLIAELRPPPDPAPA